MDRLKELYAQYGELMISLEVVQNQIRQVKMAISEELKKPVVPPLDGEGDR